MAYVADQANDRCGELTGIAWKVYTTYCKHASRKNPTCYPKIKTVALAINATEQQVYSARTELVVMGFISVQERGPNIPPLITLLPNIDTPAKTAPVKPAPLKSVTPAKTAGPPLQKLQGSPPQILHSHPPKNDETHIRKEPDHEPSQLNQPIEPAQIKNTPSLRSGVPGTSLPGGPNLPGILPPEPAQSQALIHTKLRETKPRQLDPEYETFAAAFLERFQVPYRKQTADFVQLARLRRATRLEPGYWADACLNYVTTPMGKYSLADLATRVEVFAQGRLDQYNKPANALYQFNLAEGAAWLQRNKERDEKNATH